jgi:hypothetical protein
MDIRQVPAYLIRNQDLIKQKGMEFLERHLIDTTCATGAGETLSVDDFGVKFMIASLSEEGRMFCTSVGKNEAPMGFCLIPGFIKEAFTGMDDQGNDVYSHVVNVYIHLYDAHRRRKNVLKRVKNEQEATKDGTAPVPPYKRSRPNNASNAGKKPVPDEFVSQEFADKIAIGLSKQQGIVKTATNFPKLATSTSPMPWTKSGESPDLPEGPRPSQ